MSLIAQTATAAHVLTPADHVAMPWKNGSGVTREIARYPADSTVALPNFAWRVSIADIAESCAFSRFDGYDRTLVLVSGTRMVLRIGERQPIDLALYERCQFEGEAAVNCELPDGPVQDLNVIVARGRVRAVVDVLRPTTAIQRSPLRGGTLLLHCRDGAARITLNVRQAFELNDGDTLRVDAGKLPGGDFGVEPKESTLPTLITIYLTPLAA